jgi:hypothetical protein
MSINKCTKLDNAKEAALFQQVACLIIFSIASFTSSFYVSTVNIVSKLAAATSPCTVST